MTELGGWIIFSIIILLVLLALLVFFLRKQKRRPPDYYAFFIMGIIWLVIGLPCKNYVLSAMGVIFTIVGLINKKKWKTNRVTWDKLDPTERKIRLIIVIMLGILVLGGLIVYFLVQK